MFYGEYNPRPTPFVTVEKVYNKNPDGEAVGSVFNMTLDGHIVNLESGLEGILIEQAELREAFSQDGQLLKVTCNGNTIFQTYPRVLSISFSPSNDNWVYTSPYQISLQYDFEIDNDEDSGLHPPYIQSSSESWSVEFNEENAHHKFSTEDQNALYQLRVTHEVGAVGIPHYGSAGLSRKAWEEAADYVQDQLGYQHDRVVGTGVFNFSEALADFGLFNHIRTQQIDERGGAYNVTETWVVLNDAMQVLPGNVIEDFTIESVINREEPNDTYTINGTIVGLETRTYGSSPGDFAISETKYAAASGYWAAIADSLRIYPRVQIVADLDGNTLNSSPLTKTVGHSPSRGEITYSYTYDDSPSNCITGAKSESFIITDNGPTDLFAVINVLGRPAGAILQDLNSITTFTRELSVEVVMDGGDSDCPQTSIADFLLFGNSPESQVEDIVCKFHEDMESSYDQVFIHLNNKSWDPKNRRFTRNIGWTANNCTTPITVEPC